VDQRFLQVFETERGTLNYSLGQETREICMFVRKVTTLQKPNSISKFSLVMDVNLTFHKIAIPAV
jgi:hypothetical protein